VRWAKGWVAAEKKEYWRERPPRYDQAFATAKTFYRGKMDAHDRKYPGGRLLEIQARELCAGHK
jgi:hypothetical protein